MSNPHGVEVGQIWVSADKREASRRLTVVAVDVDSGVAHVEGTLGRRSRIRLDRFRPTSTGYRRIYPTEGEE